MIKLPDSNFIIILNEDLKLIEYIISTNYGSRYNGYILLEDPIKNRAIFTSKSFLNTSNDKRVYLCKDITCISQNESYWDSLLSGKFCNGNILIVTTDKLDARTKFAKLFKKVSVAIDPTKLDPVQIYPELSKLNKTQRETLFFICNNNFTQLFYEFDKIRNYAEFNNINLKDAYTVLSLANNLPVKADDNVFNLIDDVLLKNNSAVYMKLHTLGKTEFDFSLLVNLYNTFRKLYIYEECTAQNRIGNSGLSVFDIKVIAKYHNLFNKSQLIYILKFLQDIDFKIKSGTLSTEYALDYMLAGVLNS